MKMPWNIIKFAVLIGLIVFLFGFSAQRNKYRNLTKIEIEFVDENSPFITLNSVNKMLIQNADSVTSIGKETLVLNKIEKRLLKHPMIKNADVFVSIDGVLGAKIAQRKPIARITGSPDFYLDDEGKKMPLSKVFSARVPIVTGTSKTDFVELKELILNINEDEIMMKSIVGLHLEPNGDIKLKMRKHDFTVLFGKPIHMKNKFQKFKAFYKKTKEDSLLSRYKLVNLKYDNQVVATKNLSHGE
ncbi:MAG: cell division protein FtsQ [Flavobacteriaceae bacterium]|jgi:cell division protein FtsQ